ncbi:efflux RND transporter periplasmic adaptor subunit [Pseudomonas entomophila]|uniref:efflux RND transporter periplasmic adaptor subunit n=1 Tax=Pseudomonas entomophila TaxID=312306 RepID=UPI0023D87058|nr:efflux RND transporter periplasmic adaptor subunit [Pseudomonas entomophila]MDF0731504.1 efflux RND transporter periplasmic adaptor subunit [Pseudomonas entomophila]
MSTYAHLRVILAPVAAGLLLGGCGDAAFPDPRVDHPPLVSTARVISDPGAQVRRFTGVVAAKVESPIGFRVGGKVAQRLVDVGQRVKRGQSLMRLDLADFDLDVRNRQAAVEQARAAMVKADADFTRVQGLVDVGAISARDFDQAQAARNGARAAWEAASSQLALARNSQDYADLRADSDGIVVERLADSGQVVAAGQPVLVLAQDGAREALVDLPETLRPALGSSATARLYGQAGQAFTARLRELSGAADAQSRTYRARYVLDGDTRELPLGATIVISIPTSGGEVREVPLAGLYDRGEGPGVWVVASDNTVHYRPVKVLRIEDERALVGEGVAPGELLVALGVHQLHEGQQVRVVEGQQP